MDKAEMVVGLAKAMAWPLVVGGAVLVLRKDLGDLLRSLFHRQMDLKAGSFEAKLGAPDPRQQAVQPPVNAPLPQPAVAAAAPTPANVPAPAGPTRLPPSERPAVNVVEQRLFEELASVPEAERVPTLVRALSLARLEAAHATVYSRIFGSQIAGLRRLNGQGRVTLADARAFFQSYAERFPPDYAQNGFERWLGFLLRSGLVLQTPDGVEIAPLGRDFLIYLDTSGLSEDKAG
ncbi:hypothetical protein SAMN02982917_5958 [Azospirillum oryzae]|uniref:Uncharacterized protein n=2 Tax=Azospirillum oryzae TaxID=286727 RepID=A0A1X7HI82_9PROT|nr:hypothetical protein SAMN02982917_5958 [Azospirillum oryzae]